MLERSLSYCSFFFFFSSRRRHTRFDCDWSSDVCSSDLSSGWAPTGLTVDFLASKGIKEMPQRGIYSVTVPGVAAGWHAMRERFGTKPFSELLAPAIWYAETGFAVSERLASGWPGSVKMHNAHPNARKPPLRDRER